MLNSPSNNQSVASQSVSLNTTVQDSNVKQVSLYLDGTLNEVNTSGINATYVREKSC